MERIGQVGRGWAEAGEYDLAQHRAMDRAERVRIAAELRDRFFGKTHPDLRTLRLGVKGHRLVVA
jgi:hypothetical protein